MAPPIVRRSLGGLSRAIGLGVERDWHVWPIGAALSEGRVVHAIPSHRDDVAIGLQRLGDAPFLLGRDMGELRLRPKADLAEACHPVVPSRRVDRTGAKPGGNLCP